MWWPIYAALEENHPINIAHLTNVGRRTEFVFKCTKSCELWLNFVTKATLCTTFVVSTVRLNDTFDRIVDKVFGIREADPVGVTLIANEGRCRWRQGRAFYERVRNICGIRDNNHVMYLAAKSTDQHFVKWSSIEITVVKYRLRWKLSLKKRYTIQHRWYLTCQHHAWKTTGDI